MLIVSFAVLNTVSAAITSTTIDKNVDADDEYVENVDGTTTTTTTAGGTVFKVFSKVIGTIGKAAMSGVGSFITPIINVLSIVMWILLEGIFRFGTASWSSPLPDAVVFNKVPILDANFVNPHKDALVNTIGTNLAANLFATFRVIAETIFIIAAMITGLKLALSTIATKKAQYKEATMKWVAGFALLFALKWIIAGVFYINEELVADLAALAKVSNVKIPIYVTQAIPIIGQLLTDLVKSVASLWGGDGTPFYGTGYYGIIGANLVKAVGGDIIASIVAFVIIGQSFVVLGSYFKRLFMCLVLGVLSPLIVAVDTITGIAGTKSTVFITWLKSFVFTVFTQAFHAAYLVVVFQVLAAIYKESWGNQYLQSIITIMLTTGLVKMEKMLKGMFGFGESAAGSLSDGSKGMKKAMQAGAGLMAAAKSLGDNKGKMQDAAKRRQAFAGEKASLLGSKERDAYQAAKAAKANGNMDEYRKQMKLAADARRASSTGGNTRAMNNAQGNSGGNGGNSGNGGNGNKDYLQSVLDNHASRPLSTDEKIAMLDKAEKQAIADEKSAKFASVMGVANLAAGIGMGIGMGDDIGEALFKGGMITSGLDRAAEGIGARAGGRKGGAEDRVSSFRSDFKEAEGFKGKAATVAREYARPFKEAKEIFTDSGNSSASSSGGGSSRSSRSSSSSNNSGNNANGSNSRAQEQNVNVTVDVTKIARDLSREMNKSMSGMGEDMARTLRKELRNIDKDLDNN